MRINFFLNILSIHQAPLIRKLSEVYKVTVYYEYEIPEARSNLGWYKPDFGISEIYKLDDINEQKLINSMNKSTVNIFSGLKAYPLTHKWLIKSLKTPAKNYVQMESLDLSGPKGFLRKMKYIALARKYNRLLSGMLTQGGKNQLKALGFKRVYEFAYFIDANNELLQTPNTQTKFVFIGALSKRKRILDLIIAIPDDNELILDIYGAELDIDVNQIISHLTNKKNITYCGVLNNSEIPSTLNNYDYLILPSESEGWGAVVGEALLSGTGVVVNDVAGITEYIKNKFSKHVYIKDLTRLDELIDTLNQLPPLNTQDRKKIKEEAEILSSSYGAELLKRYLNES